MGRNDRLGRGSGEEVKNYKKGGQKGKENKQGVSQGTSGPEGPTETRLWMIVEVVRVGETGGGSQRPSGPE